MTDATIVQPIIGYLQGNPLLAALLGGITILFLISLIRKLVKLALFSALALGIGVYYVAQEAPAFWDAQVGRLEVEIGESGRNSIEEGKETLKELAEKELAREAEELNQELKKKADELTE